MLKTPKMIAEQSLQEAKLRQIQMIKDSDKITFTLDELRRHIGDLEDIVDAFNREGTLTQPTGPGAGQLGS